MEGTAFFIFIKNIDLTGENRSTNQPVVKHSTGAGLPAARGSMQDMKAQNPKMTRRSFLKLSLYAVGAAASTGGYAFWLERNLVSLNTYRIPVPGLPPVFEGLRIAQLTDLHQGWLMPAEAVRRAVHLANNAGADLIVNTGDNVRDEDGPANIDSVWKELAGLRAPLGVYSVLGNHDHYAGVDQSIHRMDQTGQNLRHRCIYFERAGSRLWLGGAGDRYSETDGIDRLFSETPEEECKILLAHNPDTADLPFRTPVDLVISGHTHGGQIRLPFLGAPVVPVRNPSYVSGLVTNTRRRVFISRGVGWGGIPLRLNCPPEVALLVLTRAER